MLLSSICPRIYGAFAVVQEEEMITVLQIKPENERNHSCLWCQRGESSPRAGGVTQQGTEDRN